jgi:hypothetical protein
VVEQLHPFTERKRIRLARGAEYREAVGTLVEQPGAMREKSGRSTARSAVNGVSAGTKTPREYRSVPAMLPLLHSALLAEGCIEHYQWSARTVNVGQAASR